MNNGCRQRKLLMAVMALWTASLTSQGWAGQPLNKVASQLLHGGAAHSAPAFRMPAARLDLRAPAAVPSTAPIAADAFPSAMHHSSSNSATLKAGLPALGSNSAAESQRQPGKVEQLARNFHRDGLPLAKLWQNQDSLVHLGLSPKGKPGLWLIQKLH
jgi:hypothetical protein